MVYNCYFVIFDNISSLTASTSYTVSDFETGEFEVQGVANGDAFYIEMPSAESGVGITTTGSGDAEFEETERCNKSVDENGGPRLEYPKYPSFHKIETLADRINSFVSSKV